MKACASNPSNQFGVKGLKNKKGQNNRMERRKANHSERTMKSYHSRSFGVILSAEPLVKIDDGRYWCSNHLTACSVAATSLTARGM